VNIKAILIQPARFSEHNLKIQDFLDLAGLGGNVHYITIPSLEKPDLEKIFEELNVNRHKYPISYSMSVNDVIIIMENRIWKAYQCKDIGWSYIGSVPIA